MGDITINNYGPKSVSVGEVRKHGTVRILGRERDVVINGVPQDHIQRLYILYLIPPSTLLT